MYYLFVVTLEDCPYSMAAIDLLNSFKIKYKHLKVNKNEKEKFKTVEINTFPQIYLKKNKTNDSLLLGGYNNLKEFVDTFINQKYDEKKILEFQNKYQLWHKKPILRLIEIINQK
jgi:glutaredoxin